MAHPPAPTASPATEASSLPLMSIWDVPPPIFGHIIQQARKGTRGRRFLTYATVSRSWLDARLDSVCAVYLRGDELDEALAGGLDMFEELSCVCVKGYQGASLPADLGSRLKRVGVLQLKNCLNLKELPGSIGELASLRKVNLINLGQLASLPGSLWNLTNLESLSIWDCGGIRRMSTDSISALTKLKDLVIDVHTSQIPDSIQGLPHVEMLRLRTDRLNERRTPILPVIHGLQTLKRLSIRCIQERWGRAFIVSLSPTLSTLQQLEHLDLRGVATDRFPDFLGRIPGLRSLFLVCNCLTSLPPGFPVLETLSLKILRDPGYGDALIQTGTPHPIPSGSYPSLKHLNVSGSFSDFPDILLSPSWNLRLDVRGVECWTLLPFPGSHLDVKELLVACNQSSGRFPGWRNRIALGPPPGTVFRGLRVLKVIGIHRCV